MPLISPVEPVPVAVPLGVLVPSYEPLPRPEVPEGEVPLVDGLVVLPEGVPVGCMSFVPEWLGWVVPVESLELGGSVFELPLPP